MRFLTDHLLKLGLISKGDFNFIKIAHDVKEAVDHILLFYRNYRSSRWVGSQLVLRINKQLIDKALSNLNKEFADVLRAGKIEQRKRFRRKRTKPRSGICRGSCSRRIAMSLGVIGS